MGVLGSILGTVDSELDFSLFMNIQVPHPYP